MALWRATVRKAISGSSGLNYKWSNVWYVESPSVDNAWLIGQGIWSRERNFHNTDVFCYDIYVSDLLPTTAVFKQGPPTSTIQFGLYSNAVGDWYHSSIVQRVDLLVTNSRASRKFYRIPFRESDIVNGISVASGFNTALTTGMDLLLAVPELRDESGNPFGDWSNRGLTTRRLGREAAESVPNPI